VAGIATSSSIEMAASLLTGIEFERPDNGMEIAPLMPSLNRGVKFEPEGGTRMRNLNLIGSTVTSRPLVLAFIALVLFFHPTLASGQSSPLNFVKSQTAEGLPYMTGGITIEERQRMSEQSSEYNLKLIFAENAGIYLADVKVAIENDQGEQIGNVTSPGPWFFIQLPPGKYDVKATFDGRTMAVRKVPVSKSQQSARIFHWDLPGEPEHPELLSQLKSEKGR
jgi:hypothetical protein